MFGAPIFPFSRVPGIDGSIAGRLQTTGQNLTYGDLYNMLGMPPASTNELQRDSVKLPDPSTHISNFDRTIETLYAGRNLTIASVSLIHRTFLRDVEWYKLIIFPWVFTEDRNIVVHRHMVNVIPHQYMAHGVPGRTMSMLDESFAVSKQTQNNAVTFDLRALSSPIFGPQIISTAIYALQVGAEYAIFLRCMGYMISHGASVGAVEARGGKARDDTEDMLLYLTRNFASLNIGLDKHIKNVCDALNILHKAKPDAWRFIIGTPGTQTSMHSRVDPAQAGKIMDYAQLVGYEMSSIIKPLRPTTFSTAGMLPLIGVPNTFVVEAPDIPVNERQYISSLLNSRTVYGEFVHTPGIRALEQPPPAPHRPNTVYLYDFDRDSREPILLGDALNFMNIFDERTGDLNTDVRRHVDAMNRERVPAPFETSQVELANLRSETNQLRPYDPVQNGVPLDKNGFLFSYWSTEHQQHRVTERVGQIREKYLPTPTIIAIVRHMMRSIPGFPEAVRNILEIARDLSGRPVHPEWIRDVVNANLDRILRPGVDTLRLALERCPTDRKQGYAVIDEFPANPHGGMNLPENPRTNVYNAIHVGACFGSGPGIRTLAREAYNSASRYGALGIKCMEALQAWDRCESQLTDMIGSSATCDPNMTAAWFHKASFLTRFLEVFVGGVPLFVKVTQPDATGDPPRARVQVTQPHPVATGDTLLRLFADGSAIAFLARQVGMAQGDIVVGRDAVLALYPQLPHIARSIATSKKLDMFATLSPDVRNALVLRALLHIDLPAAAPRTPAALAERVVTYLNTGNNMETSIAAILAVHQDTTHQATLAATGITNVSAATWSAIVDARNALLAAILASGAAPVAEIFSSSFTDPATRGPLADLILTYPGAVGITYGAIISGGAVDPALSDAARISIQQAERVFRALVVALPDGMSVTDDRFQSLPAVTAQSVAPTANSVFIRAPLVVSTRDAALSCYVPNTQAVVGAWNTGYGTPARDPDDAWPEPPFRGVSRDTIITAFRNASAPINPHKLASPFAAATASSTTASVTAPRALYDTRTASASTTHMRAAEAYRGEHALQDLLQRREFLGVDMYHSAVFQSPDINVWMDGPMKGRLTHLEDLLAPSDEPTRILTLAYMLLPLTAPAMRALDRSLQFLPFRGLYWRWSRFRTAHQIVTTQGIAELNMSRPVTAISTDGKTDSGWMGNRIDFGIVPKNFMGVQMVPHCDLKGTDTGLNTRFFSSAEVNKLGDTRAPLTIESPCMLAMAVPLTDFDSSILRLDGQIPNRRFQTAFSSNIRVSRVSTMGYYLGVYPGLLPLLKRDAPIHTTLASHMDILKPDVPLVASANDTRNLKAIVDGTHSPISLYNFAAPHVTITTRGDDVGHNGVGRLGELRLQGPGCRAVYRGEQSYFPQAATVYSQTYTQ